MTPCISTAATPSTRRFLGLLAVALILAVALVFAVSWTYEQSFESLSTGDLNGQDSWTGHTDFDVTTAVACGGSKSVGVAIGDGQNVTRTLPAEVQDGNFYIQVRRTGTSDGDAYVLLSEDSTNKVFIKIGENGDVEGYNGSTYVDLKTSYAANTCLTINVEFNDATQPDQWRARVHDGTSWGSFSSWIGTAAAYGSMHAIELETASGTGAQTVYFDTITLTDPTGDAIAPTVTSANINSAGTLLTVNLNENVTTGGGGNGGFVLTPSGGASTVTYSSGTGTSALVFTLSRTIGAGETLTLAYTQPGNGWEDTAGNDLATFSGAGVTNNVGGSVGKSLMLLGVGVR